MLPTGRGNICHLAVTNWSLSCPKFVSKECQNCHKNLKKFSQFVPRWANNFPKLSQNCFPMLFPGCFIVVSKMSQKYLKVDPKLSHSYFQVVPCGGQMLSIWFLSDAKWSPKCPSGTLSHGTAIRAPGGAKNGLILPTGQRHALPIVTKVRVTLPNWMIFRNNFKRPSTPLPPPHFRQIILQFFFRKTSEKSPF